MLNDRNELLTCVSLNSKDQTSLGHAANIHSLHVSDQPQFSCLTYEPGLLDGGGVFQDLIMILDQIEKKNTHLDSIFILVDISPMKARGLYFLTSSSAI